MKPEPLDTKARRAKERWYRRVMYSDATSTEKCFSYFIKDMLNCVTLDAWPSQTTLRKLLGRKVARTPGRAAKALQKSGFLLIKPRVDGSPGYRYAPIFVPDDQYEKNVRASGQS